MRELAALWDLGTNGKVLHQSEIMSAPRRSSNFNTGMGMPPPLRSRDEYGGDGLRWGWMRTGIGKDSMKKLGFISGCFLLVENARLLFLKVRLVMSTKVSPGLISFSR